MGILTAGADAAHLRAHTASSATATPLAPFGRKSNGMESPLFEVINRTDIDMKSTGNCLCPLGKFWNQKIGSCQAQGEAGFSCAEFPEQQFGMLCRDGLLCKRMGEEVACGNCSAPDKCQKGM